MKSFKFVFSLCVSGLMLLASLQSYGISTERKKGLFSTNCVGTPYIFGKKGATVFSRDMVRGFYIKNKLLLWCDMEKKEYLGSISLQLLELENVTTYEKKSKYSDAKAMHFKIPLLNKARGRTALELYVCNTEVGKQPYNVYKCSNEIGTFISVLKTMKKL